MEVIKRFAGAEPATDLGVNLCARNRNVERGLATGWELPYPVRVIAFMRTPNQHFARAQGADDFGSARQ